MSLFGAARFMAGLGWDAAEALAELLGCNAAADSLYARAQAEQRLAAKEAEEEVAEPQTMDYMAHESVLRSGGHLKQYGPRPRITTASPSSAAGRASVSAAERPPTPPVPGVEWEGTQPPSADVERAPVSGSAVEVEVPGVVPQTPTPGTPNVNEAAGPILREGARGLRQLTTGQSITAGEVPYWRNVAHCLEIYADECEWVSTKHTVKANRSEGD